MTINIVLHKNLNQHDLCLTLLFQGCVKHTSSHLMTTYRTKANMIAFNNPYTHANEYAKNC